MKLFVITLLLIVIVAQVYSDDDPTSYIPRGIYLESNDSLTHDRPNRFRGLRIINGYEARVGQFPYQVALGIFLSKNTFFCGGALLTSTTVLTAAHCIQGALEVKVFLGVFNLMDYDESGSVITFVEPPYIVAHPNYSNSTYYNDIAIITLDTPVQLSDTIKTVKLPTQPVTVDNSSILTISGWGKIRDSSQSITDKLQYYNISGQDYVSCSNYYQTIVKYNLSSNHFCTSGVGKVGPCRGDSGGPLVRINQDGTFLMVGLNSLGVKSCEIGAPTVYTETYKYLEWIKANSDYTD